MQSGRSGKIIDVDYVSRDGVSLRGRLLVRAGDSVVGLTGNIRYSRGSGGSGDETYRLMPTTEPVFVATNPSPA